MFLSREYSPEELEELNSKATQFHDALFSPEINSESIEKIINILCTTNNEERQLIRKKYKKDYNHPIQMDIKAQLEEKYPLLQEISIDMFDTPFEYDARELKKILSEMVADEDLIIEIFCTRPKNYLEIVDLAYKGFYEISLKEEIKNQFQKEFSQYLLAIMETERPKDQTISGEEAEKIAEEIDKNGYMAYCIDIELFKKTFLEKSREDLILISRAFYKKEEQNLYNVFKEENIIQKSLFDEQEEEKKLRNKNIKLIKGLLFGVITPAQLLAKKCFGALSGFSSDIRTLFRVLINREEIDIHAIRDYYYKETKSDLVKDIENDFNGSQNPEIGSILISFFK